MENLCLESVYTCLARARNMLKAREAGNARNLEFRKRGDDSGKNSKVLTGHF